MRAVVGPRLHRRGVVDSNFYREARLNLSKFYGCAGTLLLLFWLQKSRRKFKRPVKTGLCGPLIKSGSARNIITRCGLNQQIILKPPNKHCAAAMPRSMAQFRRAPASKKRLYLPRLGGPHRLPPCRHNIW